LRAGEWQQLWPVKLPSPKLPPALSSRANDVLKDFGEGSVLNGFGGKLPKSRAMASSRPGYRSDTRLGEEEMSDQPPDLGEFQRPQNRETVLIVDDEPAIRMLISEVLEELGYLVLEAHNSTSGLQHLQDRGRVDLLVTDVGLPGGMNGRQLADAALALRPDLKVLFITGYAESSVAGHLRPGMHVLTKPFTIELLAARIQEILPEH
jgi:CheY-like chemotaxis protein